MATNKIAQLAYSGKDSCLTPANGKDSRIYPINVLGSESVTGDFTDINVKTPYQQIVLNGVKGNSESSDPISFERGVPYYLRLQIPRDSVYDMNFALLLIPEYNVEHDLDQLQYQFIRYIHVPKQENSFVNSSEIVLYEYPDNYEDGKLYLGTNDKVQVKIAKPDKGNYSAGDKQFLWYTGEEDEHTYYEIVQEPKTGRWIKKLAGAVRLNSTGKFDRNEIDTTGTKGKFFKIGLNSVILTHSWVSTIATEPLTYELIFTPRGDTSDVQYKYLYLYLLPSAIDNDILWLGNTGNQVQSQTSAFYGRHVDLNMYYGENPKCKIECYKMSNLLKNIIANKIGIWGRSELMFTINGEEIKIGPSGYYELQNFDINYLGVAARSNADQFTIDLQY